MDGKIFLKYSALIFLIATCILVALKVEPEKMENFVKTVQIETKCAEPNKNTDLRKNDDLRKIDDLRNLPVIFVVGHPGSGTTLMKTILEVSPKIHCGLETRIIPSAVKMVESFKLKKRNPFIKSDLVDNALRLFLTEILTKKDEDDQTEIFCAKDPSTMEFILYLSELFSQAKFIYMVRDGRGSALSIMQREKVPPDNLGVFNNYVYRWNIKNRKANNDCAKIGPSRCKPVKYEDLVENQEQTVRSLTQFLNIEYSDDFLNHEDHLKKELLEQKSSGKNHRSFGKLYNSSLDTWTGKVNYDKEFLSSNYEMFKVFGYNL